MQERHRNKLQYFKEQGITTEKYIIPLIEQHMKIDANTRVLEIGCGEGGNLYPFAERGCECLGIDTNEVKIKLGQEFFAEMEHGDKIELIAKWFASPEPETIGTFDLIVLKDFIEHVDGQEKFMSEIDALLKPGGRIFYAFPLWHMPFGGHQQVCNSKILSKWVWLHLWPNFIYRAILKAFKEPQAKIDELMILHKTGLTIGKFRRLLRRTGWKIDFEIWYLINPNYEVKFGLKPRKQWWIIKVIPGIRNFFTTCCYYLVTKAD